MTKEEYSRRLQFEHELISRRIGWLLTSQTIFFGAYGITIDKLGTAADRYRNALPVVAIALALAVLCGVLASFFAKHRTWRDFKDAGNPTEPFWVRTWITYVGFVPDFALPLVFVIAWLALAQRP